MKEYLFICRLNIILIFTESIQSPDQKKKKTECNQIHSGTITRHAKNVQSIWIKIYTPEPPANQKPRNKIFPYAIMGRSWCYKC